MLPFRNSVKMRTELKTFSFFCIVAHLLLSGSRIGRVNCVVNANFWFLFDIISRIQVFLYK